MYILRLFNQTLSEYLVNLDRNYRNHNLELVKFEDFENIHRKLSDETYGNMQELKTPENLNLRDYSFLNSTFIFVKKVKVKFK